jgi:AraC family L-rhamnose operon transcriptional activator RhaR
VYFSVPLYIYLCLCASVVNFQNFPYDPVNNASPLSLKRLARCVSGVSLHPENYERGRRRAEGALPDNITCFSRRHRRELHSGSAPTDHFHHYWVLLAVLGGSGTLRVNRINHALEPGMAALIPPLHFHNYSGVSAGKLHWFYARFEWPGRTAPSVRKLTPQRLPEEALGHLLAVINLWRSGAVDAVSGTLLSAELLAVLLSIYPWLAVGSESAESGRTADPVAGGAAAGSGAGGRGETQDGGATGGGGGRGFPEDIVTRVRREVEAQPHRFLSLAELARRVGLSTSHLCAVFRAQTGISIGQHLRESRLRQAAILLSEGVSVKETAERLGFRDMATFSRAFSHTLGLPPSRLGIHAKRDARKRR